MMPKFELLFTENGSVFRETLLDIIKGIYTRKHNNVKKIAG